MSRTVVAVSLLAVLAGLVVVGAIGSRAAVTPLPGRNQEAMLYDGDLTADSGGIKVTYWGSGKAESTHDVQYQGPDVLKVSTEGPYQGVVLQLGRPADLSPFGNSKDALLDVRIKPAIYKRTKDDWLDRVEGPDTNRTGRGGTRGGGAGGTRGGGGGGRGGGGGGGMRGGGGGGGGMRGGGGGGGGGGMRGGGGRRGAAPGTTRLASTGGTTYQLELTQMGGGGRRGGGGGGGGGMRGGGGQRGGGGGGGGMRGGGGQRGGGNTRGGGTRGGGRAGGRGNEQRSNEPKEIGFNAHFMRLVLFTDKGEAVAQSVPIDDFWKDTSGWYRVSYPLSRFDGIEGATRVQAVGVYTDEADTFYLGQVRVISDYAPVKATITGEPNNTTTGTVIEFSIGFDGGYLDPKVSWDFDEADGVQKQAAGTKVKYLYTKPGDYMVTATIEDRTGTQTGFQKQYGVHIEQGAAVVREKQPNELPDTTLEGHKSSGEEGITIERGGSLEPK